MQGCQWSDFMLMLLEVSLLYDYNSMPGFTWMWCCCCFWVFASVSILSFVSSVSGTMFVWTLNMTKTMSRRIKENFVFESLFLCCIVLFKQTLPQFIVFITTSLIPNYFLFSSHSPAFPISSCFRFELDSSSHPIIQFHFKFSVLALQITVVFKKTDVHKIKQPSLDVVDLIFYHWDQE